MHSHILHNYLRDTLVSTYKECISCKIRTQFTCVKCGYCYSCHWKKEGLEKVQSQPLSPTANSGFLEKYPQAVTIIKVEQSSSSSWQHQQTKVIDVYGQQTEPICSYRTCHHKFSVHGYGNHNCKCRHPLNYATGVSISPLTKEEGSSRTYD